jgi:hypothetical protein
LRPTGDFSANERRLLLVDSPMNSALSILLLRASTGMA